MDGDDIKDKDDYFAYETDEKHKSVAYTAVVGTSLIRNTPPRRTLQ